MNFQKVGLPVLLLIFFQERTLLRECLVKCWDHLIKKWWGWGSNLGNLTWEPLLNLFKLNILPLYTVMNNVCLYLFHLLYFTFYFSSLSVSVLLVLSMVSKLRISFRTKLTPDEIFSYQTSLSFFFCYFSPSFSLFLLSLLLIFSRFNSGGIRYL